MSWTDNADLTEPDESDGNPILGVTGGQRARPGDTYTLAFLDDGEEVETENGLRAAFDARLLDASFDPVDGDNDRIEAGDDVRFMSGSARLNNALADHAPVGGKVLEVEIVGTGFDAEYAVTEVEDADAEA